MLVRDELTTYASKRYVPERIRPSNTPLSVDAEVFIKGCKPRYGQLCGGVGGYLTLTWKRSGSRESLSNQNLTDELP